MYFDHIVLNVTKMNEMIQFYNIVLQLPIERLREYQNGEAPFPIVRLSGENIIDLFPKDMWGMGDGEDDLSYKKHNMNHFALVFLPDEWEKLIARLGEFHIKIEEGPVQRGGAKGEGVSIYFKDPDENLIEARCY